MYALLSIAGLAALSMVTLFTVFVLTMTGLMIDATAYTVAMYAISTLGACLPLAFAAMAIDHIAAALWSKI